MVRTAAGAIALACAAATLAGCATIVHGTTQQIRIDSIPPGADVDVDDSEQQVITPAKVKLSRGSSHRLVFHKKGYQDATRKLTSSPSGWLLGNVIAGGVVGLAIDASDGAGRKLSADSVAVTLTPLPPAANTAAVHRSAVAVPVNDNPPSAQPHDVHPVMHEEPAAAPARPNGRVLKDFTDSEAGFAPPAMPRDSPQGR